MPDPDRMENLIINRIADKGEKFQRLKNLIEIAHIEKQLISISTFEEIFFVPDIENIRIISPPTIDRLTLVHPPSFSYSVEIQVSGFYRIKYKQTNVALPIKVEPFIIQYTGILVEKSENFEFRNEAIRLVQDV
jgi:hypothetical protein